MGQETRPRKTLWVGSQPELSDEVLALWTPIQAD